MRKLIKGVAMILSTILSCGLFFSCSGGGNGESSSVSTTYKNKYDVMKLGEIPISMWVTLPAQFRNEEQFRIMRESGINVVNGFEYYETDEKSIKQALDLADGAGLKYLVSDSFVSQCIEEYQKAPSYATIEKAIKRIASYSDMNAYAGQLLRDEPNRSLFSVMEKFVSAYRENYPEMRWHINMFPAYATGGTGVPYEQYVDDWLEMVNPDYYSFDYYPCLEYDSSNYFAVKEKEDYFYNLDLLRCKTVQLGIPYWSFIQTCGIGNKQGVMHSRTPSREDIRWQVFTNLAFGAKGLQYFCYFTPSGGNETFTPSMIDLSGNKTERYGYVKELNEDFNSYGKILLRCDAEGIILNTKNPSAKRYKLFADSLTGYSSIEKVDGSDCVIGCFKDTKTGKHYALITPTTPRDNINVNLTLTSGKKSLVIWNNSQKNTVNAIDGVVSVSVNAGDAVFIEL